MFDRVGIVGVGLLGASLGLALRKYGLSQRVLGIGRNEASLRQALEVGAIDSCCLVTDDSLPSVDLLVLCTPVDEIVRSAPSWRARLQPSTLVTDTGSTKQAIVEAYEREFPVAGPSFVGGHPVAGSERRGPRAGFAELFEGKVCVLTPTERTDRAATERVGALWRSVGMKVLETTPAEHDAILGLTSHLPHLVAAALVQVQRAEDRCFMGSGFRDTTRIASGDPDLWTAIFRQNRYALLHGLDRLDAKLDDFRRALINDDKKALGELLEDAKRLRDALGG